LGGDGLAIIVAIAAHEDLGLGVTGLPNGPGRLLGLERRGQCLAFERPVDADQGLLLGQPEALGLAIVEHGTAQIRVVTVAQRVSGRPEGDRPATDGAVIKPGPPMLTVEDDGEWATARLVVDDLDLAEQVTRVGAGTVRGLQAVELMLVAEAAHAGRVRPLEPWVV